MLDTAGKLWNIERINPADYKDKRGLYGGRRTGLYHSIGKPAGRIIVCEGYATGASIHEATGDAVAVAFNAGNVPEVAAALRSKFPQLKIILAADDDYLKEGNPGLSKAKQAAQAVGGLVAAPQFGNDRPDGATDFNDLHQLAGLEAVKSCLDAAIESAATDASATGQIDLWPEPTPLPNALPPVQAFDADLLPEASPPKGRYERYETGFCRFCSVHSGAYSKNSVCFSGSERPGAIRGAGYQSAGYQAGYSITDALLKGQVGGKATGKTAVIDGTAA